MEIKDLSKYSTTEKIILAEQLWDSISKKDLEISEEVTMELDHRIQMLEDGKTELYTWEEVKSRLEIRQYFYSTNSHSCYLHTFHAPKNGSRSL